MFEALVDHAKKINEKVQGLSLKDQYFEDSPDSPRGFDAIKNLVKELIEELPSDAALRLQQEYFANGPLEALLEDPGITEIIINDFDRLWIEKEGRLLECPDCFLSQWTYEGFLRKLYLEVGQEPTLLHPFIDGEWMGHRIHLVGIYGQDRRNVQITIRKHKKDSWRLEELKKRDWASSEAIEYLKNIMALKKNILVIGPTGSGKTSVLKALLRECEPNERVVILEDSREIEPPNASSTHLLTRMDAREVLPNISLSDLVRQSLRMRPDRVVVGEVRGGEAKDLLLALATGHSGSAGTLHASDAGQALLRLEMLIQMGAPHWSLMAIRRLIYLSLNYVLVCQKNPNGHRTLEGLYRLVTVEESGVIIEKVYFNA